MPDLARARQPSTDSTLSQILRSTEQRLQEGGTSGVATRNKAYSVAMMAGAGGRSQESSPVRAELPSDSAFPMTCRSLPSSPDKQRLLSPGEHDGRRFGHRRMDSISSMQSDADSLFAIYAERASREFDGPTALTSPSKAYMPNVQPLEVQSPTGSDMSGQSLSTVYSEDEGADVAT